MSLWFRRRDKQGTVHWYSVGVPWSLMVLVVAVALALLLSLFAWLRGLSY